MEPIVNRVAESDIDVFDLESLWDGREIVPLDLEPFLYQGLVLREADFRERVKQHDWSYYADRHVAVFCSADRFSGDRFAAITAVPPSCAISWGDNTRS